MELPALLVPGAAALAITVAAIAALRPIAHIIDLVDRPGGHKTHTGIVPVVGGLAMLVGLVFGLSTTPGALGELGDFVFASTLLVVVGLLDDRFSLSPQMRLVAQFVAVLPMVFGAGVSVHTLGDLFGQGSIQTGDLHLVVTAFIVMAAINAFNMLDGMDGLAGGVALTALLALSSLGATVLGSDTTVLVAVLVGAIVGFLVFNAPVQVNRRIRCFMGDAGSTLLGFALAWLTIAVSQQPSASVKPITMVWFVLVPATDLVWTVLRRIARGHSPLYPDKEHLHHSLLAAGFGVRAVFVTMLIASALGAMAGLSLDRAGVPEWLSLVLVVGAGVSLVVLFRRARLLLRFIPARLRRTPPVALEVRAPGADEPLQASVKRDP